MLMPAASAHVNSSYYENDAFGVHLRAKAGYNIGIFGKANFNTMQGFDRWFEGACLGYGCTFADNESPSFHTKSNETVYATSLIGNKSIEWLNRDSVTGASANGRPFFLYFAPHCPHTPATPADWYSEECAGVVSPRNPAYNYTDPGLHELIARQPPLTTDDAVLIDDLARRRCQCLMSVDDAHAALVETTKSLDVFDKTYWFISSDHGYNLGHHRIPSNKFLVYDHALKPPMLVRGPGVKPGINMLLGTNVDFAPTWLALAGIDTPASYDGRSWLSQLVPPGSEDQLPAPSRTQLIRERAALAEKPWRLETFSQYYNQGGPSPLDMPDGLPWNVQGWSPGSAVLGFQDPGGLGFTPLFPRDKALKATIRPLDDYSNTYIALHVNDSSFGNFKYAEYQYACSTAEIRLKSCFSKPDFYELFDLSRDPFELNNIYNVTKDEVKTELHRRLRAFYPCRGRACP